MNTHPAPDLPEATRADRWQPIRCGLLDLYRFEDEVFIFEGGRLLLRGNNGTGKSRVLALTLPFLLEGEIASHRVEPDGDPAKKMEWNLLMGHRSARLGYTWIEFGRRLADGAAEYVTLGCGLKAAEGRGLVAHWFFVTSQRIGKDLFLAENRVAHSKAKLEQAIGAAGKVITKASEYRQEVDAKLFGLGAQYDALLNLLVQLRQPQLSRKFDEELVSRALSDALPPLSDTIIGEVAEAFRNLQTEADELANVQAAHAGTETFLREYRRYTQIVARRRAARVLAADRDHGNALARQRQYGTAKENATRALADIAAALVQLEITEAEIVARQQALRESEDQQDANRLAAAHHEANAAGQTEREATELQKESAGRFTRAEKNFGTQQASSTVALATTEQKKADVLAHAQAAALEREHRNAFGSLDLASRLDLSAIQNVEQQLAGATSRRLKNIEHLEKLEATVRDRDAEWQRAQHTQVIWESQRDAAIEDQAEKSRSLERATEAVIVSYQEWTRQLVELAPVSVGVFEERFMDWVETGEGSTPLTVIVQEVRTEAEGMVAEKRANAKLRNEAIEDRLARLNEAHTALEKGRHQPPPPPPTRKPDSREGRAGAPFYTFFDFREDLEPSARAGLEAALEASGLLDAWITPEGHTLNGDDLDTVIVAGNIFSPSPCRTLCEVLRPEADSLVRAETLEAVLRSIGLGADAGHAWVGLDGSWQLGPLHGTWRKPAPQHLGASAREQERQRQMAEIERQQASDRDILAAVENELEVFASRQRTIEREANAAPMDSEVRQAISNRNSATAQVNKWHQQVEAAEHAVRQCRAARNAAVQARDRDADDLSLGGWLGKLSALKDNVHTYRSNLGGLWRLLDALVSFRAQTMDAEGQLVVARSEAEKQTRSMEHARKKHAASRARYEALEASAGASVRQLQARQEELAAELNQVRASRSDRGNANLAESNKLAVAESSLGQILQELERTESERNDAASALQALGKVRLLGVAHDDFRASDALDWTAKGTVETARRIETLLHQTASGEEAWKRNQDNILEHIEVLKRSLAQCEFAVEPAATGDGIFVVNVPFQGRTCTMSELREALASDITTRHTLLATREREAIEKYLLEEVASELHRRLREGEAWVRKANEELTARPMQTGMALHFKWEPHEDGVPGLLAARKQLLQLGSAWSPADRKALGDFLHEQITQVRRNNFTGGWKQHLEEALDYRRWHRFKIEQKRDGEWKRLTKRTHGTGSGGEKAVALTLPQFAAAAAHYQGVPHAPRLILLDEAFVGVDSEMRRKCMDLLTIFDLDLVMTSEREWGCYPTVPALAIYQLARREGIDAVGITRWVWNGKGPFAVNSPVIGASAPDAPSPPSSVFPFHAD